MRVGKQILVVDELEASTDNIVRILKGANYTSIDCVHNAGSALSALRTKEYDLVITDAQMQPISGLELVALIKADARLRKVRKILIGSHGLDDMASLGAADGYVSKPFEPQELKEKVEDVLSTVAQLASG
jgi:two-component system, chemotaxis family, chemotaxis protein CheY